MAVSRGRKKDRETSTMIGVIRLSEWSQWTGLQEWITKIDFNLWP